uniref:Peptidase A1 domain-containing protein n=1 Tax=Oryza barthii TaxID=65489 RepID=A0A0D3GIL3_9ORYZ
MAAAAARCAGHGGGGGFLLRRRLLAAAAFLAAFGLCAAAADDAATGRGQGHDHVMLSVEDMFPDSSSSSPSCDAPPRDHRHDATSSTTRMTIVHRHGPCSPLAAAHGEPPSHGEILAADQSRAESIQHRVSTTTTGRVNPKRSRHRQQQPPSAPAPAASLSSSTASLPASPGRALGTGNYVVTVGLGTPASRYTVVFDTGSDTTWVQCQPCVVACYEQREKLFDPASSSTYANVSCAAPACSDLDVSGCSGGHCLYGVQYGDGSYSIGFFAMDTLTLSSYDAVKGFRFGCGERNDGLFGEAAGLLGLGRGKTSLPVQTYGKYGGVAIPTVSLLFQGGAALDVDASGIMYTVSASQVCLAFAGNEDGGDVGIVGNTQLKTFGVAYDIGKKVVGFSPGAC